MEVNALDLNDTNKVPELDLSTLNNQQNYLSDADFTQAMKRLAGVPMNTPVSEISALQRYQDEVDLMQATESNLTSGKIDADMAYKAMNAGTIAGAADTLTSEKAVLTRAAAENLVSIKLQNDDTYRINTTLNNDGDINPEFLVARQLYADWWLEEQRERHKGGTGRKLIQRALVPFVAGFGGSAIATAGAASGNSLATVLGTSIVEGGDAGWDMYMLGDTLHHVQEDARQKFVDIVYDYNKTPDQVIKDLDGLSQYLDRYPDSYLEEIYEGMEQGATNYSGFGNFFGGASLVASGKIITAPIKAGRSIVSGATPRFIKRALNKHLPDRFKSAEYVAENMDIDKGLEKKVDQIYQEKSTIGTSEEVAKEKIKETTKTDTPQETIEAAKGVERNLQEDTTNAKADSDVTTELHVIFKNKENSTSPDLIKRATSLASGVSNSIPQGYVLSEADIAQEANRVTFVHKRGTGHPMTSEEADNLVIQLYESNARDKNKQLVSTASPVEFDQAQLIRKSNEGSEMVAAGNYFSVEGEKFAPASKNYYTGKALRTNMRKILDDNYDEYLESMNGILDGLVESVQELKLKNVKGFAEGYQGVQLNLANLLTRRIKQGENLAILKQMLKDYMSIARSSLQETSINLLHDPDYLEKATKRFGDSFTKASIEDKKAYLLHIALEEDYKGIQETVAKGAVADVLLKHSDELKATLNHATIPSGRDLEGDTDKYLYLGVEAVDYKTSKAVEEVPSTDVNQVYKNSYNKSMNKLVKNLFDLKDKTKEFEKNISEDDMKVINSFDLELYKNAPGVTMAWDNLYQQFIKYYTRQHIDELKKLTKEYYPNEYAPYMRKVSDDVSLAFKDWAAKKGIYGAFHSDVNVVMYDASKIDRTLLQEIWTPDSYVQNVLDNGYAKMYDSDENGYVVLESVVLDTKRPWQPFTAGARRHYDVDKYGRNIPGEEWFYDYNAEGLKK